jgi:hypothetical protein
MGESGDEKLQVSGFWPSCQIYALNFVASPDGLVSIAASNHEEFRPDMRRKLRRHFSSDRSYLRLHSPT